MSDWALWLRFLHIVAFTAWMAGLWCLPRLFVDRGRVPPGGEAAETFKLMQRRLLRYITTPAMLVTFVTGIWLGLEQGQWADGWLHIKTVLVLLLAASHGMMARYTRAFARDGRPAGEGTLRWLGGIPTVLFLGIVLLVVFKPFF